MTDKEIDMLLSDPMLSKLTDDNFNAIDFISKAINSTDIETLVDNYYTYIDKSKQIDDVLTKFAAENQDFLFTQFTVAKRYGVC